MTKVILHTPCVKCGGEFGVITEGTHRKLSCNSCKAYIKFVGKYDVFESADDIDTGVYNGEQGSLLDEINFKLDLILDHLDIRVKSDVKN